jgi:hypothetical protein
MGPEAMLWMVVNGEPRVIGPGGVFDARLDARAASHLRTALSPWRTAGNVSRAKATRPSATNCPTGGFPNRVPEASATTATDRYTRNSTNPSTDAHSGTSPQSSTDGFSVPSTNRSADRHSGLSTNPSADAASATSRGRWTDAHAAPDQSTDSSTGGPARATIRRRFLDSRMGLRACLGRTLVGSGVTFPIGARLWLLADSVIYYNSSVI